MICFSALRPFGQDLSANSNERVCVQVYQVLEPVLKEKVKAEDHLKVRPLAAASHTAPGSLQSASALPRERTSSQREREQEREEDLAGG